jgi:hypothetical protein
VAARAVPDYKYRNLLFVIRQQIGAKVRVIRKTQTMRIALKRSLFGDTQNPNKAGFAQNIS